MAKRFTDTDKWKRPWFRKLPFKAKLVWFYLLDNCDHCGVWAADFELLEFQTGMKISEADFAEWFAGKFKALDRDKFFFPSFIAFQQGALSPQKNAHKPIIAFLEKNGLSLDEVPIPSDTHQVPIGMGPSKGNSKGKGKSKEGGPGETEPDFDFEAVYAKYPLKEGKANGLKTCKAQIKTPEDFADLEKAVDRYRALNQLKEPQFLKHFSTFMNCWRDYLDDEVGTADTIDPAELEASANADANYIFQAVRHFGSQSSQEARKWLGDRRWHAVELFGGWRAACGAKDDKFTRARVVESARKALLAPEGDLAGRVNSEVKL